MEKLYGGGVLVLGFMRWIWLINNYFYFSVITWSCGYGLCIICWFSFYTCETIGMLCDFDSGPRGLVLSSEVGLK